MPDKNAKLTTWALWQRCRQGSGSQAQKMFWSDIVLFMKNYPAKAGSFAGLMKKIGVKGYAGQPLAAPMPLIVKKLLKYAQDFTEKDWQEVIDAWSGIKPELKIKTQTALLQHETLIKNFLAVALTDVDNSKKLLDEIVKESGLLPRYHKNDIILMLCNIIANSLAGQDEEKEPDDIMVEDKVAAEDIAGEDKDMESAAEVTFGANLSCGQAETILGECLSRLRAAAPAASGWDDLDKFLAEMKNIIEKKATEKEEIIARNKLVSEFGDKLSYLTDVFCNQLAALGVKLPARQNVDDMSNNQLAESIAIFSRLQTALARYKETAESKSASLADEKKRVGLLFTAITDIESISQAMDGLDVLSAGSGRIDVEAPPESEHEHVNADEQEAVPPAGEESAKNQDDEEQMELFVGK